MKRLVIDTAAIRRNIGIIRKKAGPSAIYGVLTGDGYGAGLTELAALLREEGIDRFAVQELEDVQALREHGFETEEILLLRSTADREELNQLIEPEITETVESTMQTIEEAKNRGVSRVDQVVLAGGSSNIPLVAEKVSEALQNHDTVYGDNVSTLISRGAAVLAKQYKNIDSLTQPITNVDLGVVVTDGVQYQKFNTIIPAGTDLPCQNSCKFRLFRDGQQKLEINYYERDSKNYPKASRVGDEGIELVDTLVIDSLPANLKKTEVTIEVTFCAQKDGTLDMDVALTDQKGCIISQEVMKYQKKSDLE